MTSSKSLPWNKCSCGNSVRFLHGRVASFQRQLRIQRRLEFRSTSSRLRITAIVSNSSSESELLARVANGDQNALAELFSQHRDRLWRMVTFRMDPRLHGRVDADDVLQEAWLSAVQRIDHFLIDASRSIFVWFRLITSQTLVDIHRRHLNTQKRNARAEFSIDRGWSSSSTSTSLSFHLLDNLTSPSEAALREEMSQKLNEALTDMKDIDREVLALRHFEQLTNREAAQVLGISEQAASDRYIRALGRLKTTLTAMPGYLADEA